MYIQNGCQQVLLYAIWQLNMLLIGSVMVKLIGSSSHPKFYE